MNPIHRSHRSHAAWACALALALAPAPAAALPLLSEVLYDADGADDGLVFVELYGAAGALLDGLRVEGVNGANGSVGPVLELSGVFPADGVFVVADEASGDGTGVANADLLLSFDFQNGPDSVVLRDDAGVLDALGYGAFDPEDVFAGEGTPAPDSGPGASLARRFADVDSDDNLADWEVLEAPTPGSVPLASVPEPGVLLLAGAALASAALRARAPRRATA